MDWTSVAVVGAGYVGLPVACTFAANGLDTLAVDIVQDRVDKINRGQCPIVGDEPGLAELLASVVNKGKLVATTDSSRVSSCDAIVVCVDTPVDEATKRPLLDILKGAARTVGSNMRKGVLISIESTVPPRTMSDLVLPIIEEASGMKAGTDFSLVHCPERVMPGRLLHNLTTYDRVIGGHDPASVERGLSLYSKIMKGKLHPTDLLNAELSKTLENAYRDVQIAFANEVALACEELGADAFEVRKLVNTCPFRDMHIPGSGVGGHCLPKDSWLFASSLKEVELRIVPAAREINEQMPRHMVELTEKALAQKGRGLEDSRIAVLGLAFLRDSDDTRHSPSITIIDELAGRADVVVHDPFVAKPYRVPLVRDLKEALTGADCLVIVTDHSAYQHLDLEAAKALMRTPAIVDGRNVLSAERCAGLGFAYRGIGKGAGKD
jgi:UDP-N-acetyl-D-mannosaminuronic acid dehydrogenase